MARKIEMHWVCSSCGTRNLGRHKQCQHCGDPKDASEPWIMPEDTRAAPSVTDPGLLRQASAGADWQCGYCGSHQKRLDGACAQCGAAQREGKAVPKGGAHAPIAPAARAAAPASLAYPVAPARRGAGGTLGKAMLIASAAIGFGCCAIFGVALVLAPDPPPPPLHKPVARIGEVAGGSWRRVVHVERYRVVEESGFAEDRPADAFEVASLGQAHHHDEQVLDHYETEHYTEQVPFQDTETYTDQERCGEDCTAIPETCHEVCTPDENGFASCHDECSGGGQSCSPRYCSVTRTRQVTRYRDEPRTRQVPRYRSEPRFAERFRWRAWRWGHERDVTVEGTGDEAPRWPEEARLTPPAPLAEGERERTTREEIYTVTLRVDARDETLTVDPGEYARLRGEPRWYLAPEGGTRTVKPVRVLATDA